MPGFDREIAKLAQRVLINPRSIDYHTGVLATKVTPGAGCGRLPIPPCNGCGCAGHVPEVLSCWSLTSAAHVCTGVPGVKPVIVELTDFKTKEVVDHLEVDAVLVATGRAPYTQVLHRSSPVLDAWH